MLSNQSPYSKQFAMTYTGGFNQMKLKKNAVVANPYKIGLFMSKDKRAAVSQSFRSAHFQFGFDCKQNKSITNQRWILCHQHNHHNLHHLILSKSQHKSLAKDSFKDTSEFSRTQHQALQANDSKNPNKQTNIVLAAANKTFYNQTVNNQFFTLRQSTKEVSANNGDLLAMSQELKKDLRKAHFQLGSDLNTKMTTTNMDSTSHAWNPKDKMGNQATDNVAEKDRRKQVKSEMRGHHFNYGSAVPIYSSMSKMQFKAHNLADVQDLKEMGKTFSKEMKTVSVLPETKLNTNPNRFKTNNALNFLLFDNVRLNKDNEKSGTIENLDQLRAGPTDHLKKSNFSIGHNQERTFESMNKTQQNTVLDHFATNSSIDKSSPTRGHLAFRATHLAPFNQTVNAISKYTKTPNPSRPSLKLEDHEALKKDLRASHFQIGSKTTTDPQPYQIFSHKMHDQKTASIDHEGQEKLENNLKKESFKIAQHQPNFITQKNLSNFYSTVYKVHTNDSKTLRDAKPAAKADCDATISSVQIGFYNTAGAASENKARFQPTQLTNIAENKQTAEKLSKMIQKHNFEFTHDTKGQAGADGSNHFQTTKQLIDKGSPFNSDFINKQKEASSQLKSYLQSSNIRMGSFRYDQLRAVNPKAELRRVSHQPSKTNRTGSEVVLGTNKNEFRTANSEFYSWIQPKVMQ